MSRISDLGASVRDHGAQLGAQINEAASQEAVAQADGLNSAATDTLSQTAQSAKDADSAFDPSAVQAQAVQQISDHIEGLANTLRGADMGQLATQATDMARRNPLLFVGAAAVAGFAAARFLKARAPKTDSPDDTNDPWAAPEPQHTAMAQMTGGETDV